MLWDDIKNNAVNNIMKIAKQEAEFPFVEHFRYLSLYEQNIDISAKKCC